MAPHQSKKCSRSSEWHSDTSSSCICCSGVSSKHSTPLACGSRTRANIHASVFSTFNTSSLFLQTHFTYVWALFACIWPFGLFSVRLPVQLNVCLAFFFPICFCFFCCFFSSFPFTAFPTELLPGWLILILTLLINWLFFKVISICPSAGETASSQHSLANTSSSLCRLPLVQVMVLFGPDDKAWAFFRQIYNNGNNGVIPRWAGCWVIYTQFCIVCPYIFCDHLSETDAYASCPKAQLGRKKEKEKLHLPQKVWVITCHKCHHFQSIQVLRHGSECISAENKSVFQPAMQSSTQSFSKIRVSHFCIEKASGVQCTILTCFLVSSLWLAR